VLSGFELDPAIDFAGKKKMGRRSHNCKPARSHGCVRKDGSMYCVSLARKCRMGVSSKGKAVAEYVKGKVKAKTVTVKTETHGDLKISQEGFDLFTGGSSSYTPQNVVKLSGKFSPYLFLGYGSIAKYGDEAMKNKWRGKGVSYHGFDDSVIKSLNADLEKIIPKGKS
jgi:hypothetical protein